MNEAVYLDYASLWPMRDEAAEALADARSLRLGDPQRLHQPGRRASDLLEQATASAAEDVGADEVVWTSGGTEATHLAVLGTARSAQLAGSPRRHLVVSAVEHSSVLSAAQRLRDEAGYEVELIPVDGAGVVDLDAVARAIRSETLSVHVQHANHEVGAMQPTFEISRLARDKGALLHVDACQTVGQTGVTLDQLGADLVSASAAKFGGPVGVGFLALRRSASIAALLTGDERQHNLRAGQLDVASLAAAAVALRVAISRQAVEFGHREVLRRWLRHALTEAVDDLAIHGPLADAHPGIVACSALYVDGSALVHALDTNGFAVHSGSSCAATSGQPSHVLVAMQALTHGHVRISLGPGTTHDDLAAFVASYQQAVTSLRASVNRDELRH